MTDQGFLYDDPNITKGDPTDVFAPGINTNYFLISRPSAILEFDFINPIEVSTAVHLQGGAYNAYGHNFRVFINENKIDNTDPASTLWYSSASYDQIQVIPFAGQMTSLRIESVDPGDPDEGLISGNWGNGVGAGNIFVDGETEPDKIVGTVVQTEPGQTKLTKETPYDTKLTVAGPTDLADMTGSVLMTDGWSAWTVQPNAVTSWSLLILKVLATPALLNLPWRM